MDVSFFTSELTDVDYRIFNISTLIIENGLKGYVFTALTIYFTYELIKMMYFRQPMDIPNLLIAFIIGFTFYAYSDVVKLFDQEMHGIYKSIRGVAAKTNMAMAKATFTDQKTVEELKSYTSEDDQFNLFDEFFTGNLSDFIYMIMMGLRKTFLLFLYCIGPVCMILSMFPIFGLKVLKNWFFYVLNVHLWELGFIVLQIIQSQIGFWRGVDDGYSVTSLFSGNGFVWGAYNITTFLCFGMVPFLTGKMLIGLSQPSSFATRTLGTVAMAGRSAIGSYKQRQASQSQQKIEGLGSSISNGASKVASVAAQGVQSGFNKTMSTAGKTYGNITKNFKNNNS